MNKRAFAVDGAGLSAGSGGAAPLTFGLFSASTRRRIGRPRSRTGVRPRRLAGPGGRCLMMSCITTGDPQETHQLQRLAGAIEQRVGRQRFAVWFQKSTRLRLTSDGSNFGLEISVPNDFISDWIGKHFTK